MSTSTDTDKDRCWKLLYNLRLRVRYHTARQRFFDSCHRTIGILSLIFSSAAIAAFTADFSIAGIKVALWSSAFVAISQIFDLIIDTRKRSSMHRDLRRKYLLLEARLMDLDSLSQEDSARFNQELKSIECEEPPILCALMDVCHREVNRISGIPDKSLIPLYKKLTRNFFSWSCERAR